MIFRVINSYSEKSNDDRSGAGIGLDNLQKRLSLIYGKNAKFIAERNIDQFEAEIIIIKQK